MSPGVLPSPAASGSSLRWSKWNTSSHKKQWSSPKESQQWPNEKPSPISEGQAGLGAFPLVLKYSASTGCSKPHAHVMFSAHYSTNRSSLLHTSYCMLTHSRICFWSKAKYSSAIWAGAFEVMQLRRWSHHPSTAQVSTVFNSYESAASFLMNVWTPTKCLLTAVRDTKMLLVITAQTPCAEMCWWLCCRVS